MLSVILQVFDNHRSTRIMKDRSPIDFGLWDTGGREDYHRIRPLSYPNTGTVEHNHPLSMHASYLFSRFITCFWPMQHTSPAYQNPFRTHDTATPTSTCSHQSDVFLLCFSIVSRTSLENVKREWEPEIREHCPNTPIVLCGTKSDMRNPPVGSKEAKTKEKRNLVCITREEALAMAQTIGKDW